MERIHLPMLGTQGVSLVQPGSAGTELLSPRPRAQALRHRKPPQGGPGRCSEERPAMLTAVKTWRGQKQREGRNDKESQRQKNMTKSTAFLYISHRCLEEKIFETVTFTVEVNYPEINLRNSV